MQYGVNRGGLPQIFFFKNTGTVKFHVACLRPQTSHKHTFTSMHTTGAALAGNLHHPRPVCKNWLVKNFEFLVKRRSKKNRFWGLTPKPEAVATESMGGGL